MRFLRTLVLLATLASAQTLPPLRPPATPLVAVDPYFSLWSMADQLNGDLTRHWTGKPQRLTALARIDGTTYRVMGRDRQETPALPQTRLEVLPTRTLYEFTGAGVRLGLTFLTPALPSDLELLSRPATYLTWTAESTDGRPHRVAVYFDASYELAVDTPDQPVVLGRFQLDGRPVLRVGTRRQPILEKAGDDVRIDWGYLYLAAGAANAVFEAAGEHAALAAAFEKDGRLPDSDDFEDRRPSRRTRPALAVSFDLGQVGAQAVSRYLVLAYDDVYSLEYFERRVRPWWRRNGDDAAAMLRAALRDYSQLKERSEAFDRELMADLTNAGGAKYARLAALAYRQTLAAHKLVADADGTALYFPKENFSNGCIGTVDVFYPSSPFFLLFNPELLKAQMRPVLDYARMGRWKFPFAPHDLGTYPHANGQVYGGGEKTEEDQMPVEESGNMLILAAAVAQVEGKPDFAVEYWPLLARWAAYLKDKGLDPENQLSTDDFAGHLAHNANLSIKAIVALASYARLADMAGKRDEAAEYRKLAEDFARRWVTLADDGDHYRLAFDKPGTWSQKYNLVWDRLLGLNLFPPEVARREIAFYKTKQLRYGLPLDNRKEYTKLDWIVWTATLAESPVDFEAFIAPVYRFAGESPSRVPLTDWYWTNTGKQEGFQARSVVGGVFVKMLADPAMWKKWSSRAGLSLQRASARFPIQTR